MRIVVCFSVWITPSVSWLNQSGNISISKQNSTGMGDGDFQAPALEHFTDYQPGQLLLWGRKSLSVHNWYFHVYLMLKLPYSTVFIGRCVWNRVEYETLVFFRIILIILNKRVGINFISYCYHLYSPFSPYGNLHYNALHVSQKSLNLQSHSLKVHFPFQTNPIYCQIQYCYSYR